MNQEVFARVVKFLAHYGDRRTDDIMTVAGAATDHEEVTLYASDLRFLLERIEQLEDDRKTLAEMLNRSRR